MLACPLKLLSALLTNCVATKLCGLRHVGCLHKVWLTFKKALLHVIITFFKNLLI